MLYRNPDRVRLRVSCSNRDLTFPKPNPMMSETRVVRPEVLNTPLFAAFLFCSSHKVEETRVSACCLAVIEIWNIRQSGPVGEI